MGRLIEEHISVLQNIDRAYRTFTQEEYRALEYAIASLKTDLKYDLMYEGEEVYTKADMIAMLTEIQLECEENTVRWYVGRVDGKSDDVVLIETLNEVIQQKINALKGE